MRTQEDVADYIMSHAIELRALAKGAQMSLLVYFLDLVIAEACSAASDLDGKRQDIT